MRALVVFRTHKSKIGPPHVVNKEENDVGLRCQARDKSAPQESEEYFSHEETTKNGNSTMVKLVYPNLATISRAGFA